jgi:hypothetical protein
MVTRASRSGRDLGVVLHGLERRLVAVEPDVADARRGDQLEHAVEQPVARAQDRDEDELLAQQDGRLHRGQRRLDGPGGHRQIPRDLVGEQQRDLA